jgi:hypothetical protein
MPAAPANSATPAAAITSRRLTAVACRLFPARVAAADRVADPIALAAIEQDQLVCVGHGIVLSEMSNVSAAIGKDQMRCRGAFLGAAMPARSPAGNVPQSHLRGAQQDPDGELVHAAILPQPIRYEAESGQMRFPDAVEIFSCQGLAARARGLPSGSRGAPAHVTECRRLATSRPSGGCSKHDPLP